MDPIYDYDFVIGGSAVEFERDVYYDPRTNQFLQLRERHEDHLVFSEFSDWYRDSRSTILRQDLPLEYLEGLKKVERIEDLEEAEYDEIVLGWRVRGERLEPSAVES